MDFVRLECVPSKLRKAAAFALSWARPESPRSMAAERARPTRPCFEALFGVSTFETVWGFRLEEGFGLIAVT